jgi:hypothetical protein
MYEIIPIITGVLLGVFVGSTPRGRASTLLVAAVAVLVGFFASSISGELEIGWSFVIFDIGQVVVAYLLARTLARRVAGTADAGRPR